jgi:hypothetical protein
LRYTILSRARLPVPPHRHKKKLIYLRTNIVPQSIVMIDFSITAAYLKLILKVFGAGVYFTEFRPIGKPSHYISGIGVRVKPLTRKINYQDHGS